MDPRSIYITQVAARHAVRVLWRKPLVSPVFLVRPAASNRHFLRGRYVFGERGYVMESHWLEDDDPPSPSFLGMARHVFGCVI